jgi:uncharacterized DUF497 family protein
VVELEFDLEKSAANTTKHGIGFVQAQALIISVRRSRQRR